ncbi:hypothetical protein THAOC_32567, partial [Thalassiosira oceanica]
DLLIFRIDLLIVPRTVGGVVGCDQLEWDPRRKGEAKAAAGPRRPPPSLSIGRTLRDKSRRATPSDGTAGPGHDQRHGQRNIDIGRTRDSENRQPRQPRKIRVKGVTF